MNIDKINKQIRELNRIKKLLTIPINEDDPVEDKIFKKYLELENVSKVAEYINGVGHRVESNNKSRKYIANDISSIITDKNIEIKNRELQVLVMKIFKGHKKGIKSIK